jgi:hypothetical protein
MKETFNEGQAEYHAMNRVNVNAIEPEVEKEIVRIKEKRAAEKAKKEQKEAEKEAKRAAKEIAKQRKAAGDAKYNSEKRALRERIDAIMREDNANNASASYKPAQEQNVTVVLPQDEVVVTEEPVAQPAANSGEEAALGNYLNR